MSKGHKPPASNPPNRPEDGGEPQIWLVYRPPSYELEPCRPGSDSALKFAVARRRMIKAGDIGYATFAHMVNMREFVSQDGEPPKNLAVMRVNKLGEFELGFHMELFNRLSPLAQTELLKMQVLRIPYGHFSQRSQRMVARYGPEIANRAAEMVLSQVINPAILAAEGVVLPVPEMWELDRNLSWEEYCKQLADIGGGEMPSPMHMVTSNGAKTEKVNSSNGMALDDKGLSNVSDLESMLDQEPVALENASRELLDRVNEQLKRRDSSLKAQGFMAGDALEFIEALERSPQVDWAQKLRGTCGRFESRRRKINKHRPSRRGWPLKSPDGRYVDYYKGRIRKKDTAVLFVIDTSGSMSSRELRCVESELRGIAQRGTHVMVLHADADVVDEPEVFHPWTKLREFKGRGGTSFAPAFRYAEEMTPRPDLLIYYTDGFDYHVDHESDIPTLWLLTSTGMDENEFKKNVCSWGETLKINVADGDD